MRTVCVRQGVIYPTKVTFAHDETPNTYEEAEAIAGVRLDRRRNYTIIEGKVCEAIDCSGPCWNCEGFGCRECGYHGKRRSGMWVPIGVRAAIEDAAA